MLVRRIAQGFKSNSKCSIVWSKLDTILIVVVSAAAIVIGVTVPLVWFPYDETKQFKPATCFVLAVLKTGPERCVGCTSSPVNMTVDVTTPEMPTASTMSSSYSDFASSTSGFQETTVSNRNDSMPVEWLNPEADDEVDSECSRFRSLE